MVLNRFMGKPEGSLEVPCCHSFRTTKPKEYNKFGQIKLSKVTTFAFKLSLRCHILIWQRHIDHFAINSK